MIKIMKEVYWNSFLGYYIRLANKKQHENFKLILGKIHLVGLGYKNFVYNEQLFILLGNANYMIFKIPEEIYLFCRKNQIYFFTTECELAVLNNFISKLKRIKRPNLYKGKGVIEFKNFKFLKLKQGKKQRF